MGTKNNPGSYDCYANAHPDEPMFVLLGRDPAAAAVVRLWTALRERLGEKDTGMLSEATACANAMETWAREHGKDPDAATRQLSALIVGAPREHRTCCNSLYVEYLHAPDCTAVGSPCPGCGRRRGDSSPKCYLC